MRRRLRPSLRPRRHLLRLLLQQQLPHPPLRLRRPPVILVSRRPAPSGPVPQACSAMTCQWRVRRGWRKTLTERGKREGTESRSARPPDAGRSSMSAYRAMAIAIDVPHHRLRHFCFQRDLIISELLCRSLDFIILLPNPPPLLSTRWDFLHRPPRPLPPPPLQLQPRRHRRRRRLLPKLLPVPHPHPPSAR
jgi:hypothetical protein